MALSDTDKRIFQRYAGRIDSDPEIDDDAVETLVTALGSARAAALQILMERLGDFESQAANVGSDADRSDHEANIAALRKKIAEVVAAILNGDDTLTPEGDDLVEDATGRRLEQTTSIDVIARHRRRG